MIFLKLYDTTDELIESSSTGYSYFMGEQRLTKKVPAGDFCGGGSYYKNTGENVSAIYAGSSVTATVATLISDWGNYTYYMVNETDVYPERGLANSDLWFACSGNSLNELNLWDSGPRVKANFDRISDYYDVAFPLDADGYYCVYIEEGGFTPGITTFSIDKSSSVVITPYGEDSVTAYTCTSDNGKSAYAVQDQQHEGVGYDESYSIFSGSGNDCVLIAGVAHVKIDKRYENFIRKPKPGVALSLDQLAKVYYNKVEKSTQRWTIKATYNVENVNEPTQILTGDWARAHIQKAVLDGNEEIWNDSPDYTYSNGGVFMGTNTRAIDNRRLIVYYAIDGSYNFQTTGTHEITYYVDEPEVARSMFYGSDSLVGLEIGSGITKISVSAISLCKILSSITIPSSISEISTSFYGTSAITKLDYIGTLDEFMGINYPSSTYPNNTPFGRGHGDLYISGEPVTNLVVSGVTAVNGLFIGCGSLTSITVTEGVIDIGSAFTNCINLKNVTLPSTLNSAFTFVGCSALETVNMPNGLPIIPNFAFSGLSSLTAVMGTNGLTKIGMYAFANCTSLTGFSFPASLITIDSYAFSGCTSMSGLSLAEGLKTISASSFSHCSGITEVIIPNSVTSLCDYAFRACKNIKNFVIGTGVTTLATNLYSGSVIENLTIPQSVVSYGTGGPGFASVTSSCTIDSNTLINRNTWTSGNSTTSNIRALLGISAIKMLNFGEHVTNIPDYAFYKLTQITEIHCVSTTAPTVATNAFASIKTNGTLYVPTGCSANYSTFLSKLGSGWTIVEE